MRRFFVPADQIDAKAARLSKDETRHLKDVLRLDIGAGVHIFDGIGNEYAATVTAIGKNSSELSIDAVAVPTSPESPLALTIAASVTKGDKFDLVIQKAVELGVYWLIPLETDRSEVPIRDALRRLDRWRRISMEATKQCGRARLMTVTEPITFKQLLDGEDAGKIVMFSERDGGGFDIGDVDGKLTAVYGPKGGWSDAELDAARESGVTVVTFGGRIMKAETAAIAISAILQHRYGDLR
jgi:16S rRNA (uracil1498-N3)-methyltransferase